MHVEPVVENWLVSAPRRRFSTYTLAELVSEQLLPFVLIRYRLY